jgi:hypothetical protein
MSEHAPRLETLPTPEHHELLTAHASPEKAKSEPAEKDPAQIAQEARTAVAEVTRSETQPNPLERLQAAEQSPQAAPQHINRELKQITLRRELQYIRRQLPAPQRALSKIVHQPAVRAVSENAGKTVSRPSGLLGGGLVALIGTSSYLYLAKHIGFTYNYGVFLVLFVAGFAVGLGLELLVHLATSRRRKASD